MMDIILQEQHRMYPKILAQVSCVFYRDLLVGVSGNCSILGDESHHPLLNGIIKGLGRTPLSAALYSIATIQVLFCMIEKNMYSAAKWTDTLPVSVVFNQDAHINGPSTRWKRLRQCKVSQSYREMVFIACLFLLIQYRSQGLDEEMHKLLKFRLQDLNWIYIFRSIEKAFPASFDSSVTFI